MHENKNDAPSWALPIARCKPSLHKPAASCGPPFPDICKPESAVTETAFTVA